MIRAALPGAALLLGLAGCAASPPLASGLAPTLPRTLELRETPFFPQQDYQCGPAALATVLQSSGVAVEPAALAPQVYLPERHGSLQAELIAATRRHGRLPYLLPGNGDALLAELAAGRPVLVLQNLRFQALPAWHYAVLIGYDATRNVAVLRSGRRERLEMRWQSFARSWHFGGRWAMTTLAPGVMPANAEAARYLESAAGLEAAGQPGGANIAYAEGRLAAAADAYARAVTLRPDDASARNNLAQVLADSGCLVAARRQVNRANVLAAGSVLSAAVEATRADIESKARQSSAPCTLADRSWPD